MGVASEMKELARNIASSHGDRMKRISVIREEANEVRGEAQSLITGFKASRREANQQLRGDLARGKAQRKSETRGILKEAQKLIKGFGTHQQTVNSKLRKDLSRSRTRSKSEVGELLGNAQSLVEGFQTSRRDGGSKLRGDLAQSRANMESDVKRRLSDFGKARGDVRADLKEAGDAWQRLVSTMQAKRGGAKTPVKATAPATETGIHYLETKMLAAVNQHPEGMTLAGIADRFGVAPIVLGRASKSLLDKGRIRKEAKLYFPAASE